MLKKSGIIALATLYLITVLGFAMNLHYCGSTVAAVHFEAAGKLSAKQQNCGMKTKCCKNQHISVKVKDAHHGASAFEPTQILALHLPVAFLSDFQYAPSSTRLVNSYRLRGPPGLAICAVPVFLKNCNFRI